MSICLNSKINNCKNIITEKGSVLCDNCNKEKHIILENKKNHNIKIDREKDIYNLELKIQYFIELKNNLLNEKTELLKKIIDLESIIEKLSIENRIVLKENEFYKNRL